MAKVIKQPIFAYLRQSTVNKQEVSIENQYDDISDICEREGYILKDILDYKEKRSGWERGNKKPRKEFTRMLADIDKLKTPCILLARNSSRLARNMEDGMEIIYRIKGIHGKKKCIEKIVFAENEMCWNSGTRQSYMQDSFSKNFADSEETSIGVIGGYAKAIKAHAYPYGRDNLPKGITLTRISGRNYITPTADLVYVIEAFRMRSEGITHKEISKYLALYDIKIGERKIQGTLFSSPLYKGMFFHKKTGKNIPIKSFQNGELTFDPLIPISLWESVQEKSGKKHTSHGEKFKDDNLPVKTESGLVMSKALVKGNAYYNNSAEKINLAEWKVIKGYLEYMKSVFSQKRGLLQSIVVSEYEKEKGRITKDLKNKNISVLLNKGDIDFNGSYSDMQNAQELIREFITNETTYELAMASGGEGTISEVQEAQNYIDQKGATLIQLDIEESLEERLSDLKKTRKNVLKELEDELEEIQEDRKRAIVKFTKDKINEDEYSIFIEILEERKAKILSDIAELKKDSELDIYLQKIPALLLRILELLGSTLYIKEMTHYNEDVKTLIKITTLELTVNNKKELKVKLFDTLKNIISRESLYGAQDETGTHKLEEHTRLRRTCLPFHHLGIYVRTYTLGTCTPLECRPFHGLVLWGMAPIAFAKVAHLPFHHLGKLSDSDSK